MYSCLGVVSTAAFIYKNNWPPLLGEKIPGKSAQPEVSSCKANRVRGTRNHSLCTSLR